MRNRSGITIIEILIAIFIAGIIASLSVISYHKWQQQVQLINARDELTSAISRTQQLATAAAENTAWGLHLEKNHYIMFSGDYYNENNPLNRSWNLNGVQIINASTTFADGAGSYIPDVVFGKFTGQTSNTGTIMFSSLSDLNITRTVSINSSGQTY